MRSEKMKDFSFLCSIAKLKEKKQTGFFKRFFLRNKETIIYKR